MVTTPLPGAVGQRIKAGLFNLAVNAILELQPGSWVTNTAGSAPQIDSAYRIQGKVCACWVVLTYSTAPGGLNLTVSSAVPSAALPLAPSGFAVNAVQALCYARVSPATDRIAIPAFYNASGQALVRGGATNPSGYNVFELQATYTIA